MWTMLRGPQTGQVAVVTKTVGALRHGSTDDRKRARTRVVLKKNLMEVQ
jgi:hypothetical protein